MKSFAILYVVISIPLAAKTFELTGSSHNNNSLMKNHVINVWDDVLSPSLCEDLHEEASKIGLGHRAFSRPISGLDEESKSNRPLIELAIDEILKNIHENSSNSDGGSKNKNNKTTQYVEYWTRQEWRHIEAHSDIDENLAKEQDKDKITNNNGSISIPPFRYPTKGHVLYLQVGTEVKGPTCVFPNISIGGDLINHEVETKHVDLITVPAVQGRLLRFDGDFLHSVPRPFDIWFLPFVKGAPEFTPVETWGRSVILFNTWDENPPKDVPLNDPIIIEENEIKSSDLGVRKFNEWSQTFTLDTESNEKKEEEETCEDETAYGRPAKIWLLGNERRRGYQMRTVKLKAPEQTRDILGESYEVNRVQLRK